MSTTSSRKRAIHGYKPSKPIDKQIKALKAISNELLNVLKFSDEDDKIPDGNEAKNKMEEYCDSVFDLNTDLWGVFRSSVRQNDTNLIEEKESDFVDQISSFSSSLLTYIDTLKDYIVHLIEGCSTQPIKKKPLYAALEALTDGLDTYFDESEKYIKLADSLHAKSLISQIKSADFEICLNVIHDSCDLLEEFADTVQNSFEMFPVIVFLRENSNGETTSKKNNENREKVIDLIIDYFLGEVPVLIDMFTHATKYYSTKNPCNGDKENAKKAEKAHRERQAVFDKLLDIVKYEKGKLTSFMSRIDDLMNCGEEEEEDALDDNDDAIQQQRSISYALFSVIFENFRTMMKLCQQAGEFEQVSMIGANMSELLEEMTRSSINVNYQFYSIFYNESMKMGDKESAASIHPVLVEKIKEVFDFIQERFDDEEKCTVLSSIPQDEEEAQMLEQTAKEVRDDISRCSDDLIPTLREASKTYAAGKSNNRLEMSEIEADNEEEDPEEYNQFSDYLQFFYELSCKHIVALSSDPSLIDDADEDAQSRASMARLTTTELEKRRGSKEKMEDVRKKVITNAIVGTKSSLLAVVRSMIVESVLRLDFNEAENLNKKLTSLLSSNIKTLNDLKKQASKRMDVDSFQEIDQMIIKNQQESKKQFIDCFDEALRDLITSLLTPYNEYIAHFKDQRDKDIEALKEESDRQLAYLEHEVHIPETTLLMKKILIEEEVQKNRQVPEIEAMKAKIAKLTQQREFEAAKSLKKQLKVKTLEIQKKVEKSNAKKKDEKMKKLRAQQQEVLTKLESDYKKGVKEIRDRYKDNIKKLRSTLSSSVLSSVNIMVNKSVILLSSNSEKGSKKDSGYSRKSLTHRFEIIAQDVMKKNNITLD